MRNKYFNFLCGIVDPFKGEDRSLLRHLHDIPFYSLVPNDDNRGIDGEKIREIFIDQEGPQALSFLPDRPCTLLEMLIGLSIRLEFESGNSYWEKRPDEWFWILIDNLGLADGRYSYDEVDYICDVLLRREYKYNGDGGLFPLKYPKEDQRKVEIWYQMSAYILEKYPI